MSRVRNEYPFQQFKAAPTRDMAIKAKCADCAGGPITEEQIGASGYNSDFKDTIRHCPCTDCPLHSFRPYQS